MRGEVNGTERWRTRAKISGGAQDREAASGRQALGGATMRGLVSVVVLIGLAVWRWAVAE